MMLADYDGDVASGIVEPLTEQNLIDGDHPYLQRARNIRPYNPFYDL